MDGWERGWMKERMDGREDEWIKDEWTKESMDG